MMRALLFFLLFPFSAAATEMPLTYSREPVTVVMQRPVAKEREVTLDAEIRDAESTVNNPGWYSFSGLEQGKAAMMLFAEPTIFSVDQADDFAPTDILFIDTYGTIREILPSLVRADMQEPVTSTEPVLAVLYLKGGTCAALGIRPNDSVQYSIFHKKPVVLSEPGQAPPEAEKPKEPEKPLTPEEQKQKELEVKKLEAEERQKLEDEILMRFGNQPAQR